MTPGRDGRPAEPPQRTRRELVDRVVADRGVHLRERWHLHEVEVVEKTDPGDAGDHVGPTGEERPSVAADDDDDVGERHAVPLSPAGAGRNITPPIAGARTSGGLTFPANGAYRTFVHDCPTTTVGGVDDDDGGRRGVRGSSCSPPSTWPTFRVPFTRPSTTGSRVTPRRRPRRRPAVGGAAGRLVAPRRHPALRSRRP